MLSFPSAAQVHTVEPQPSFGDCCSCCCSCSYCCGCSCCSLATGMEVCPSWSGSGRVVTHCHFFGPGDSTAGKHWGGLKQSSL